MDITLEKIELVKDRTGLSYKEAKEVLEANGGSVVDAIIAVEDSFEGGNAGAERTKILEKIKELIKKGNVSKILVKRDDEVILNIPVNVGIVGAVIAPVASVLVVAATFGFKCDIEIVKADGTIIDVSDRANEKFDGMVEKGSVIFDDVKTKGTEVYGKAKEKVAETNFEDIKGKSADLVAAGKDKARDITEKFSSSKKEDEDAFAINIAEDIENAADILEEEMAEELEGNVRIVDITEK